jgi:hypothetical protein
MGPHRRQCRAIVNNGSDGSFSDRQAGVPSNHLG